MRLRAKDGLLSLIPHKIRGHTIIVHSARPIGGALQHPLSLDIFAALDTSGDWHIPQIFVVHKTESPSLAVLREVKRDR